jgi:hypothetical protein
MVSAVSKAASTGLEGRGGRVCTRSGEKVAGADNWKRRCSSGQELFGSVSFIMFFFSTSLLSQAGHPPPPYHMGVVSTGRATVFFFVAMVGCGL